MGAPKIKMLVMDVDGTLTDGKIYMGPDGEVVKAFDVRDGYAIMNILPEMGIVPVVMTGRESAAVTRRCEELGVTHIYQGIADKLGQLEQICLEEGVELSQIAQIGDDLNDLECLQTVAKAGGIAACPADACVEVSEVCSFVSTRCGGDGAVREIITHIGMMLS